MKIFKNIVISICCIGVLALNACTPSEKKVDQAVSSRKSSDQQIEQQFKLWKAQQDPQLLADYYQFMSQYLKHPPSLMELTTSRNYMPEQCNSKRFAIPSKAFWKNVVSSLQLVEKLNRNEYFKTYTISAIYRAPELNKCIGGAEKSKHLSNYAVDFHVLSPKETIKKIANYCLKKCVIFGKWKVKVIKWV